MHNHGSQLKTNGKVVSDAYLRTSNLWMDIKKRLMRSEKNRMETIKQETKKQEEETDNK